MIINCIAIDDEPPAILQIETYINRVPYLNLLKTFYNAADCLEFLKANPVDLIFLDIEMGEFSGIELINGLNSKPKIIFATAHKSHAYQAFDLDVSDFLLKPVSFERFLKAADKVYNQLAGEAQSNKDEIKTKEYMFVKTNYRMQRVVFRDILYIEGLSEYVIIKTVKEKIITYQSLRNFEEMLLHHNFLRVHRSYIVNLDKIDSIDKQNIKVSEKEIPIGEKFKKKLFEIIIDSNRKQ